MDGSLGPGQCEAPVGAVALSSRALLETSLAWSSDPVGTGFAFVSVLMGSAAGWARGEELAGRAVVAWRPSRAQLPEPQARTHVGSRSDC